MQNEAEMKLKHKGLFHNDACLPASKALIAHLMSQLKKVSGDENNMIEIMLLIGFMSVYRKDKS